MFDFTDSTIDGLMNETDEPTIGLAELGVETLNAFYADAEGKPSLSSGFSLHLYNVPKPSGFIPRIRSFIKTVRKENGTQYYVNSEGAEALMFYKAFRDMDDEELQTFLHYMIGWPAVLYNSTDCFYLYDRRLVGEPLACRENHDILQFH